MTTATPAALRPPLRERLIERVDVLGDELHTPVIGRRVPGTVPVAVIAGLASLAASAYFVPSRLSLAYGDALSHLTIARRLFDTQGVPGLGQLGTVWLPIPHLLLAPFVVVTWLWQSGWGAALLGALCLAATATGVFRAAARWGLHGLGRLTAVAAVVANPTMLYLFSTALTEPVLIAGLAGCFAGLANWATKDRRLSPGELAIFAGIPAAAAAMSRYEGWSLVAVGAVYVAAVAWNRDHDLVAVAKYVFGFGAVPALAIAWWVGYNWVTFGDPLAFLVGPYSAAALQSDLVSSGQSTKGHLTLSLSTLNLAVVNTVGIGLIGLAVVGLAVILVANRSTRLPGFLAATLGTYGFLAVALFTGQAVILNDANSANVWNNRYGMSSIITVALVAACGVDFAARALSARLPRWGTAAQVAVATIAAGALVGQALWLAAAPVTRSLVMNEAVTQMTQNMGSRDAAEWLGEHYDGGRILLDEGVSRNTIVPLAGLPLREYYLRSDATLFDAALADPTAHARWVWASTDPSDLVAKAVAADDGFTSRYEVVYSAVGLQLYRRTVG